MSSNSEDKVGRQLDEPADEVVLARLERGAYDPNAGGSSEQLRVVFSSYRGHPFVGLRVWFRGVDGAWHPTRRGVTIRLRELSTVQAALGEAVRLGGLDDVRMPGDRTSMGGDDRCSQGSGGNNGA